MLRAARDGDLDALRAAAGSRAQALYVAASYDRVEVVEYLLGLPDADPAAWFAPQGLERRRGTPLHIAAIKGSVNALRLLVASGRGLDVRRRNGETPLSLALQHGQTAAVRVLLDAGADPNAVAGFVHAGPGRAPMLTIATWYGIMTGDAAPLRELLAAPSLHGVEHHRALLQKGARTKGRYSRHKAAAGGLPVVCAAAFCWLEGLQLLTERPLPPPPRGAFPCSPKTLSGYHANLFCYARQGLLPQEQRREALELLFASPWFRVGETDPDRLWDVANVLEACWFAALRSIYQDRQTYSAFFDRTHPTPLMVFSLCPEPWWGLEWLLRQPGLALDAEYKNMDGGWQTVPLLRWALARTPVGYSGAGVVNAKVFVQLWNSGVLPPLSGFEYLSVSVFRATYFGRYQRPDRLFVDDIATSGAVLPVSAQDVRDFMDVAVSLQATRSPSSTDAVVKDVWKEFTFTHACKFRGNLRAYFEALELNLVAALPALAVDGSAVAPVEDPLHLQIFPRSIELLQRQARAQLRFAWVRLLWLISRLPSAPPVFPPVSWLAAAPRAVVRQVVAFL